MNLSRPGWLHNLLNRQKALPFIGTLKQLLGGATTWITLGIFLFSGVAFWNTSTMTSVRMAMPWLSLPAFAGIVAASIAVMVWLEHKFVQPSIMVYWNKLHFGNGNPLMPKLEELEKRQIAMDTKLDELHELLVGMAEAKEKGKTGNHV